MFQRLRVVLAAVITLLATLTFAPAVAGAVETDWEFYGEWGVADLATDRQTRNNIYVYEIENINGTVYIGGAFQKVVHRDAPNRPIDQAFIVAFDAASGDIISSFRPDIDHPVYAIAEHPTTGAILVGGEFTRVNGVDRTSLVALDPDTGETDPTFTGIVKRSGGSRRSIVRGIDVSASEIFVGGSFGRAKGTGGSYVRRNVAKFDLQGRVDATWNVNVTGGGVWDLALSTDDQRVIFGGLLNGVNGTSRPGLAMVAASGAGALTSAFPNWQAVSPYCYGGYPGCILVYDIDVQNGKVLIAAAEHFSSLHDDNTGHRLHMWPETNDTQAGLLDGNRVWRTRHGADNTTGMYYAHDVNNYQPLVTTIGKASTGPGGFEIEKGENDCVWIGGAIGGMDLVNVPGSSKVATHHVGFMCPADTRVPESQLNIDNWEAPPGLLVRGLHSTDVGRSFGVFEYTPAPDGVKHEVLLDGEFIAEDDDGSFAFSQLEPGTTYRVEVRATDAGGESYSSAVLLETGVPAGDQIDDVAGVSVSQISNYSASYPARLANDGSVGNTAITKSVNEAWWQMDLGSSQPLSRLELWARNGFPAQTKNVHVLVSDQPFTSDSLADAQAQSSVDVFLAGDGKRPWSVDLNTTGRYIRLQIDHAYYLSIAEVNVWAAIDDGPEVVPHPNPYAIPNLNTHRFRATSIGYGYGAFAYEPAADAVRHEVYLDGNLIDSNDTDGSFAFSQLDLATTYQVELRAIDVDGIGKSQTHTFTTKAPSAGDQIDDVAGVSVSQISNYSASYPARLANDGSVGNTAITKSVNEAWWQMDLGSSQPLSRLELWARNGFPAQTKNVHVLVSDQPFTSDSLADAQAQSSVDVFLAGDGKRPWSVDLNTTGRYIRLQIDHAYYLSIAEVNVWGADDPGTEVVPHPDPYAIPNLRIRNFAQSGVGYTYGVFSYDAAPDAMKHEVYLDGRYLGLAVGGSFAISLLDPDTSYEIKLVAQDVDGNRSAETLTLATKPVENEQLDTGAAVTVEQISDYTTNYPAGRANDEVLDNISITKAASEAWWQMDLGASRKLSNLELWARSGLAGQTRNVHVLVSNQPFASNSLADAQAQSSVDVFLAGNGQRPATVDLDTTGRYIRLQISDTNYLSIAEVNVWNVADATGEVVPHPNPLPGGAAPPPPANGDLVCELDVDGTSVDVNWTGTTTADSIIVYRTPDGGDRHWRGKVPAADGTFVDELGDVSYTYELLERTGNHFGGSFDCGDTGAPPPPPPPPVGLACEVSEANGEGFVEWAGQTAGIDSIVIYRTPAGGNTHWRGKVDGTESDFTDTLGSANYTYLIREKSGAVLSDPVDCGDIAPGQPGPIQPTLACSASNIGGEAVVTLTGQTNADSVVIFRSTNGGSAFWRGKIDSTETTFTDSLRPFAFEYEIRERTGAANSDPVSCGMVQG